MIKELNYDLTKEDLKKASKDMCKIKLFKQERIKFSIRLSLFFSIITVLILFLIFIKSSANLIYCIYSFGGYLIFYYALAYYYKYPQLVEFNLKKMNKGKELYNIIIKIDQDNDYFIINTKSSKLQLDWHGIKDIYNEKNNIFIFIADYQLFLIPKRIFNSEEELNETWNLIQECYNKSMQNTKTFNSNDLNADLAKETEEAKSKIAVIRSLGFSILGAMLCLTLLLMFFVPPLSKNAIIFLITSCVFSFIFIFTICYTILKKK